jgi:hypothetical protein
LKLYNTHPSYEYIIIDWFTAKELFVEVVIFEEDDHDDIDENDFWVIVTFYSDTLDCEIQNSMPQQRFFDRYWDSWILSYD